MIAGVVEKYPLQWNLLDTQASVLRAAGRTTEANAAQNRAREVAREVGQIREYQQVRQASGGAW